MDSLVKYITQFIETHGLDRKYLLAYSGGLDSHVLLHLLAKHSLNLQAIYVNHGVNPESAQWAEHCASICNELNVNFIQRDIKPIEQLLNLEEQLREHRYHLFENHLETNAILLTAHHQNDQAETILLQLCRGAGLPGLSAMPRIKLFGQGFHARPLLDFTREDLLRYANHHQLNWIEDGSNFNSQFTRNFLRNEIMPVLMKRWPTVTKTLARTAEHCADAENFIATTAEPLLKNLEGTVSGTLSVKKLLLLDETTQRHALRAFIYQKKFLLPSKLKMQQILQTVLLAQKDKTPHVKWGNAEIRRYRDNLFLMTPLAKHDPHQIIEWQLSEPLTLPNIGILRALPVQGSGLRCDIKNVTVQFRKGGETIRLPGREHHHELKKLFQLWGVPPWLRDRVPLVYVDGVLAGIVGFQMDEEFIAKNDEPGWDMLFYGKSELTC